MFRTENSYIVVGCGNDIHYKKLCSALDRNDLIHDENFKTNSLRVKNRKELVCVMLNVAVKI